MIKLTMNGDFNWSLCRMPDSRFYSIKRKKKHPVYTSDWLCDCITSKLEKERISKSRAKSRIKEICLNNYFEYFVTLTVDSKLYDRFSLENTQDKIRSLCRRIKRTNKDFKYIFITEKHENGAFHFHGMMKNLGVFYDKKSRTYISDIYTNKNGYLSSHTFDLLGFNSFDKIKDYVACCHYITKYITKDNIKSYTNQLYFCSKGLNKANVEYMIDEDLKKIFPNKKIFENDYCQKVDFDISRLNSEHAKRLNNFFYQNDMALQENNNSFTNWLQLLTTKNLNVNIKT